MDTIYGTVSAPETWSRALVTLADHVGASGGMFVHMALTEAVGFTVVGRLRDDLTKLYMENYIRNPYSMALSQTFGERPIFASDHVPSVMVRRTAFHADILSPQAIDEMVIATHPSLTRPGSSSGGISFTLTREQAKDREGVASRFGRLVPHLSRAVDLTLQMSRSRDVSRQLAQILEILPMAAFLLDRRGTVVQMNARAEALLVMGDGLALQAGDGPQLRAEGRAESRVLSQMLARAVAVAAGDEGGFRASLRIPRPSGRPALTVVVTPLPPAAFAIWDPSDSGARALVQVVDPLATLSAQAERLKEAAALTATEARVAGLVGEGRPTPEVARMLGLSPNTVRTHLARCFDKTGARSQVALARLLTSLSG